MNSDSPVHTPTHFLTHISSHNIFALTLHKYPYETQPLPNDMSHFDSSLSPLLLFHDPPGQETMLPSLKANELLGKMPGPFAEALELVRQKTSKREANDLIEWKPSVENRGYSINMPLVPFAVGSIRERSCTLAQNADGILSLELVPDLLRRRLADSLCDTNKMSVHILELLVEGYPTLICIKNSSWLTDKQFQQIFGNCRTQNLKILQLDLCGQCMLDVAFRDAFARASNCFCTLDIVSLRGACQLSDSGLKELLVAAPALRSINLGQCSLLTHDGINFIADYLGSNLSSST